jgi:hypothetical protein
LAIDPQPGVEEYFVLITTLSGELLAFRCLYPEDVDLKIAQLLGKNTISRHLGDQVEQRAQGIFIPGTVAQALVFHI